MFSPRSIALATTAAAALVPAVASANTYCVYAPDCNGKAEWTLQDAVKDAGYDTGLARIELGPGTYSGNFVVPNHPSGLEIVGAGPEQTFLEPTATDSYALELHGGSVSQVGFSLPDLGGSGPLGLNLADGASADHIRMVIPGSYPAAAIRIDGGGHLSNAHIDAGFRSAVDVRDDKGAGDVTISDSFLRGDDSIAVWNAAHSLVARRDRLVATDGSGVNVIRGSVLLEDSLIDLRGESTGGGITADTMSPAAAAVEGRHLTVLADGPASAGMRAYAGAGDGPATVSLSDSVVRGAAARTIAVSATAAIRRVDTWPAAPDHVTGTAFTDEGSFSADPLLDADFVPAAGSPLIDAAAPLGADESATDLAGAARALDGDGNCDARPDIGALEAAAAACVPPNVDPQPNVEPQPPAHDAVAPSLAKLRIVHRRAVRVTVSEQSRLTVRVKRAHRKALVLQRSAAAGQVTLKLKHALRHGRYTIRVIAVDAAGNRSAPLLAHRRI
jgi:hypothetical protein